MGSKPNGIVWRGFTCAGALLAALGSSACDALPQAEVPAYTQNVSYNVNVYNYGPTPAGPVVVSGPAPIGPSGLAACDRFFAKTTACSRWVTDAPEAHARFDRAIDLARREDRIIALSGDAEAKAEVEERCRIALSAYDSAPCGPSGACAPCDKR